VMFILDYAGRPSPLLVFSLGEARRFGPLLVNFTLDEAGRPSPLLVFSLGEVRRPSPYLMLFVLGGALDLISFSLFVGLFIFWFFGFVSFCSMNYVFVVLWDTGNLCWISFDMFPM